MRTLLFVLVTGTILFPASVTSRRGYGEMSESLIESVGIAQPRRDGHSLGRPAEEKVAGVYRMVRLFEGFKFARPRFVRQDREGNYYVADTKNHRICVFDAGMKFKYQIGQLGQGPQDLNNPGQFVFDTKGHLYVKDGDNWRIQIFDKTGKRVGGFRYAYHKATDLAVTRGGEIYLNQATKGHLISVYSPEGKLLRQFGELMSLSRAYPGRKDDPSYRIPLSRVWMTLDDQDNLYVAYIFAPVIQKYDAKGRLLYERRLEGPIVDLVTKGFWDKRYAFVSMSIDGIQMAVISSGIVFDERKRRLFILLGSANVIYVLDEGGRTVGLLTLPKEELLKRGPGLFWSFTGSSGVLYATDFEHCYKLAVEEKPEQEVRR